MQLYVSSLVICCLLAFSGLSQEFRITDIAIGVGKVNVRHAANTNFYYILYRGDVITNIVFPTDIQLATTNIGQLSDSTLTNGPGNAYYRVLQVPLNHPLDSDGDGIDDV